MHVCTSFLDWFFFPSVSSSVVFNLENTYSWVIQVWWWFHPVNGCCWGALWRGRSQSRWSLHHLQQYGCVDAWLHWEIHLVAVLCVCVLEPVLMILPSSGQDGFGFSFLCPAHLPVSVTWSPLPPFSFPFVPSLLVPLFPDPALPAVLLLLLAVRLRWLSEEWRL